MGATQNIDATRTGTGIALGGVGGARKHAGELVGVWGPAGDGVGQTATPLEDESEAGESERQESEEQEETRIEDYL